MVLWFFSPLDDPVAWRSALLRELPDLDLVEGEPVADPAAVDCALVFRPPPGSLRALPNLKAVFSLAAGVDGLLADPTLPDVPVCRMVDPALVETIADYAHYAVLRVHRAFDRFECDRAVRRWRYATPRLAEEVTVAVLGLGNLGRAVAQRLHRAGYRVHGWSRRARAVDGIRTHDGAAGLEAAVAEAEIVIGLLPNTGATRDLYDDAFFARLRPGAHFVNIGRGEQLVEAALLRALDRGRLAGATLDVFRAEPLPEDHPFWAEPRILITPHIAGSTLPATGAVAIAENIRRLRAGRPLLHVVDRCEGY